MGVCPQCQGERLVKHGSAAGKPKQRCKPCGDQFTRTTPRGKPLATKINAVLWYLRGMSMHRMAFLLRGLNPGRAHLDQGLGHRLLREARGL